MSERKTVSAEENQKTSLTEKSAPWNPYQIFGFVFIATSIVVGIILNETKK